MSRVSAHTLATSGAARGAGTDRRVKGIIPTASLAVGARACGPCPSRRGLDRVRSGNGLQGREVAQLIAGRACRDARCALLPQNPIDRAARNKGEPREDKHGSMQDARARGCCYYGLRTATVRMHACTCEALVTLSK